MHIPPASSLVLPVALPPNSTLLVDAWYTQSPPYPHPLLIVSSRGIPPIVEEPSAAPPGLHADFEAFWTRRRYAYVIISNLTFVHLLLHSAPAAPFTPSLNATLRARIVHASACPTGPGDHPCSGRGICRAGECLCDAGYAGRYCEARIRELVTDPITVPSEKMVYFRYHVVRNGSVAVRMQLLPGSAPALASQPVMFVKRAYENGGKHLVTGPPLPSLYDSSFVDRSAFLGGLSVQRVVRGNLRRGESLYIGVYNFHKPVLFIRRHHQFTAGILTSTQPIKVRLDSYPCATPKRDGVRLCPPGGQEPWELSVTFLLLPLLLGTLTLLTMVVCVSVWAGVFRQHLFEVLHGHAPEESFPRRDKLSETEVNAMFPAFVFTKGETAALGATGDVCCSVCLCSFEEGELLRRLACGHSYHSHCLDRWLLSNATCPRCRKSARIHGDVGRGWFMRRHVMRIVNRVGGGVGWLSSLWRSSRTRDVPELESVEVEGLLPERGEGVSRRTAHASLQVL